MHATAAICMTPAAIFICYYISRVPHSFVIACCLLQIRGGTQPIFMCRWIELGQYSCAVGLNSGIHNYSRHIGYSCRQGCSLNPTSDSGRWHGLQLRLGWFHDGFFVVAVIEWGWLVVSHSFESKLCYFSCYNEVQQFRTSLQQHAV